MQCIRIIACGNQRKLNQISNYKNNRTDNTEKSSKLEKMCFFHVKSPLYIIPLAVRTSNSHQ
jgi:hypothetical protein